MTLTHPSGISATVHPLGATLRSLFVPDREGRFENILVGFETEDDWLQNDPHFGCTIGRFANRIANGQFNLNGTLHQLSQNQGNHHLHGGFKNFSKVIWNTEILSDQVVRFTYYSPAGEEGFPGNLNVTIEYILGENSLRWKSSATVDQASPVNLTCHPYFNLTGNHQQSILLHELQIYSEKYLPVDFMLIPTGELRSVHETGFDFRTQTFIGKNLKAAGVSFNHTFVLDPNPKAYSARCYDPTSGRVMEIFTNQPGIQLYLASPFENENSAFCLEPQKFPDSPNQSHFPNTILHPGEVYENVMTLRFSKPL
jgi:aldose 1-epimerase